ncbi:heterochromatin protein one [Diplocarpon rosae]|nr:heterochromatin protein one [Diplocarpon rosae]
MPPQITDDEASEVSSNDWGAQSSAPAKAKYESNANAKSKTPIEEPEPAPESEDSEEDEDEELAEDEYTVEKITNHLVDEEVSANCAQLHTVASMLIHWQTGELRFEVKWAGFERKSDRTWEPESNLETAGEVLGEYLKTVGGKERILALWEEKKAEAGKKSKKRSRASAGDAVNGSSTKKGRKSKSHPAESTPPASFSKAEFKPPTGSWEEAVVAIDACEGTDNNVVVYLTWKSGHKTQHPLAQVYKRCPQKMLQFYESHLVFKKNEDMV